MKYLGKSKIGILSARRDVKYPQLRLPRQCSDVIGQTATIYKTERDGKLAFIIVTEQGLSQHDTVLNKIAQS